MTIKPLLFTLAILSLFLSRSDAQMREWTSASDPTKKFQGELKSVEGDLAVFKMASGRMIKTEIAKLSKDDQYFIEHGKEPEPPVEKEPFDSSRSLGSIVLDFPFGEEPDDVYVRLKKHGGLQGGVNEIMRGRSGLNDHYYIELDGIRYGMYFEFENGLFEVSFQSAGFEEGDYETGLMAAWQAIRANIAKEFDKAALSGPLPNKGDLNEGGALSTDVWKTPNGRQIYLGVGKQEGKFSCVLKSRARPYIQ